MGACPSLPSRYPPCSPASAGRRYPALAAPWDSLAHTWAHFQADGAPPPPFGLVLCPTGAASTGSASSPPLFLPPPRACGVKGASAVGKPCLGYCVSFEDRFGFSSLSALLYEEQKKKKAKLNRLQPVLSCHTMHRCQLCPCWRQRPGHSEGHRQGPPGDGDIRAGPSLTLLPWPCSQNQNSVEV